ncbi:MAG: hypothetical protein DMF94_01325 [Acidobacteria bacterium]|nr:MAG: hypothetical protein DMF94_01325 [Acidobacteriota bacterium]
MTRRRIAAALVVGLSAAGVDLGADPGVAPGGAPAGGAVASGTFERHHYSISARVRPLLVFWIGRSGVGDAIVTERLSPGEATYALLIGSDPDRAPRRINRWGYIKEEIRGADARLVGLMTESDEDSIEQAEANLKAQAHGNHPFKIIRATVNGEQAQSFVTSIGAPHDYNYRQLQTVLDLVLRESPEGKARTIRLPPGTRPGFLAALADAMRLPAGPIGYVYHGRIYELRRTEARQIPDLRIASASYGRAIAADFTITSTHDGEQTRFSMTYGTEGRFAQVPLTVSFRPRWWMEVNLTLDDEMDAAGLGDGVDR